MEHETVMEQRCVIMQSMCLEDKHRESTTSGQTPRTESPRFQDCHRRVYDFRTDTESPRLPDSHCAEINAGTLFVSHCYTVWCEQGQGAGDIS